MALYSPRNVRVFISSTFRDMHAERDHLVQYIFPRLNEVLRDKNIHVDPIDLRWGVTPDLDSTDACLRLIDESAPFFLCMLGNRYGWIPDGASRSITEEEIRYAIDGDTPRCPHSFFYFRDESIYDDMSEAIRQSTYAPHEPDSKKKLDTLKEELRSSSYVTHDYHPLWNQEQETLLNLENFGNDVFNDLLDAINRQFDLDTITEITELEYDYQLLQNFIDARTRAYIPDITQNSVQEQAWRYATGQQWQDKDSITISGGHGTGKTALLAYLAKKLSQEPNTRVISYFPDATNDYPTYTDAISDIVYQLHDLIPPETDVNLDQLDISKVDEILSSLRQTIDKITNTRFVYLIDARDQIQDSYDDIDFSSLPGEGLSNVRVIDTRTSDEGDLVMGALSRERQENFIQELLAVYGKSLTEEQQALVLAKQDVSHPVYLYAILNELRLMGNYNQLTQIIHDMPDTQSALFDWIVERLQNETVLSVDPELNKRTVEQLLITLTLSRRGLGESDLADLVKYTLSHPEFSENNRGKKKSGWGLKSLVKNLSIGWGIPKFEDSIKSDRDTLLSLGQNDNIDVGDITFLFSRLSGYISRQDNLVNLSNTALEEAIIRAYLTNDDEIEQQIEMRLEYCWQKLKVEESSKYKIALAQFMTDMMQFSRQYDRLITFLLPLVKQYKEHTEQLYGNSLDSRVIYANKIYNVCKNIHSTQQWWHPNEPEVSQTLAPWHDYQGVYQFPCCSREILQGHEQFTSDGCRSRPDGVSKEMYAEPSVPLDQQPTNDHEVFEQLRYSAFKEWLDSNDKIDLFIHLAHKSDVLENYYPSIS